MNCDIDYGSSRIALWGGSTNDKRQLLASTLRRIDLTSRPTARDDHQYVLEWTSHLPHNAAASAIAILLTDATSVRLCVCDDAMLVLADDACTAISYQRGVTHQLDRLPPLLCIVRGHKHVAVLTELCCFIFSNTGDLAQERPFSDVATSWSFDTRTLSISLFDGSLVTLTIE